MVFDELSHYWVPLRKLETKVASTLKIRLDTSVDSFNPMKAIREEIARKKLEKQEKREKEEKLLSKK